MMSLKTAAKETSLTYVLKIVTSLSVLMWPHFPHLMHLTLRT